MDAITFLINEHRKVKKKLAALSKKSLGYSTKKNQFFKLCGELVVHENMEHKTWYPNFKNNVKVKKVVKHLLSEENSAAKAIKAFKKHKKQDLWEKKFNSFKKDVIKHAGEEEKKLFPKVRKILDKAELIKIGKKMRQYKKSHL